ncbi:thioredoxin family protein [Pseudomonas sp. GD03944]|uniref:thioredoxin family protein n=1 Tax=Pseudomonas sp. GD03944 TaxID=2975409 RepID=UPI0024480F91|nr:thioredoxin family protein [Pseudomonas sp. GD03944]MDH1265911.1 thioredoxin family protein [Pseudomonas sp. GD03944]
MVPYPALFAIGEHFDAFIIRGLPAEVATVQAARDRLNATPLSAAIQQRLQAVEGRYHLLAAAEMWCPDCQLNLAAMDHLQRLQPRIGLAIVSKSRAEHALKERLGLERISIPLVLVLDEQFELIDRFVEQPHAVTAGGDAVKSDYRAGGYLESTLDDVLAIIEAHEGRTHA